MTRQELEAGCLRIPCPRCVAGEGEACNKPNGAELRKPHADRVKAYAAELEAARRRAEGDALERITNPRWRRVYAACRLELENRAAWTKLAAEQLESMVRNMIQADRNRALGEANPIVPGSMGQDTANPAVALALRYDAQALQTAIQLKLTPATRGTSVEVPDEGEDPSNDGPEEERDELAAIDLMAERARRAKRPAKARRRRAAK